MKGLGGEGAHSRVSEGEHARGQAGRARQEPVPQSQAGPGQEHGFYSQCDWEPSGKTWFTDLYSVFYLPLCLPPGELLAHRFLKKVEEARKGERA